MRAKKSILRKEWFGGIFVDTATGEMSLLNAEEYSTKKEELSSLAGSGALVKLFDATERGYPLLQNAASSPMDIYFELTKKCNCSCTHCFMDSNSPNWVSKEVSLQEIGDIIQQFSDTGGFYVRLTGGEPTIRKDFFEIVDMITKEGVMIGLNTNGLFDEKTLEKILSKEIKDIRISLDGPEEVNDAIRGKGTYRRAVQTLEGIAEYNKTAHFPVNATMNVVLMKSNMGTIGNMIKTAQRYGSNVSFGLLRISGRAQAKEMLSPEEVVSATYITHTTREELGLPKSAVRINYDILCEEPNQKRFAPYPFDNSKCPIGSNGVTLDAYSRISPCGYLVAVDNGRWLGEQASGKNLLDLWHNSPVLKEARQISRLGCHGCEYHISKCNGGCPVMAYIFSGNMDGKDPYCVREIKIKK